jgi:hypothetical protein
MAATINGSPTHVLIVHAVAVLLPLSLLAALMLVFVPATRRAFGLATVGVGFIGCIAVPLAFLSGGKLRGLVPPSPLIDHHVALAHQLLPVAAAFGVVLAGFVLVDVMLRARADRLNVIEGGAVDRFFPRWRTATGSGLAALHRSTAVLLVVISILTGIAVVRAGDSGAKAAWNGRLSTAADHCGSACR